MKCDACKLKSKCDDLERAGILPKIECCRAFIPLPTRADQLRAMSDEELVALLERAYDCDNCLARIHECSEEVPYDYRDEIDRWCHDRWLDWLKQEAKV